MDFSFAELYSFILTLVNLFLAYKLKTGKEKPNDKQQKKPPLSD